MADRKQMTFYVSFWDAINNLSKKDQLPVFRAVISYGLFGTHEEKLTVSQNAFFSLIKPVLDSARKKSVSGKQGGSKRKQSESKPEANDKQNASKGEKEKEVENEVENELEKENEVEEENECYARAEGDGEKEKKQGARPSAVRGKDFLAFWEAYPVKLDQASAWEAWKSLNPSPADASKIMSSLAAWKTSVRWTEENGRYIPRAANFLVRGYWQSIPAPRPFSAGGAFQCGEAELEAIRRIMEQPIFDE